MTNYFLTVIANTCKVCGDPENASGLLHVIRNNT